MIYIKWLREVKKHCNHEEWESWCNWRELFHEGLSPWLSACRMKSEMLK